MKESVEGNKKAKEHRIYKIKNEWTKLLKKNIFRRRQCRIKKKQIKQANEIVKTNKLGERKKLKKEWNRKTNENRKNMRMNW